MISRILIGLLAILYGAIGVGADHVSIKDFYHGLILFGIVYLVELLSGPVSARLRRRTE